MTQKTHRFLNCVTFSEAQDVTRQNSKIYKFQLKQQKAKPITSEILFWQAAIDTFPLSPKKEAPGRSLDALEDSLFGGLLSSSHVKTDIVWPYVDNIRREFLKSGVEFFHHLAANLHPQNKLRIDGGEGSVDVVLHLVCSNDATCQAIDEYLGLHKVHDVKL